MKPLWQEQKTGLGRRPGVCQESRYRRKGRVFFGGGEYVKILWPFRVCKLPSIPLLSVSLCGSDSTLPLWSCICLSPLLWVSPLPTIYPSMGLSMSPPHSPTWALDGSLLPKQGTGPSFSSGSPLNKRDQWASRSSPAYGMDVMRLCHQRHQMSPDFCSVPSEALSSLYLPLA